MAIVVMCDDDNGMIAYWDCDNGDNGIMMNLRYNGDDDGYIIINTV